MPDSEASPSPLRLKLREYFPPVNTRSFLAHYLPISGAVSHTLFSVHIFSPSIVSRLFPVGELAISNSILFNANLGIGFYVFFRDHMRRLNAWDRVEYSVFTSTLFNFGSLLAAVLVKALLPNKTGVVTKSVIASVLSFYLLSRGRKYLKHIDRRCVRSPRSSAISSYMHANLKTHNGSSAYARGATPTSPVPPS